MSASNARRWKSCVASLAPHGNARRRTLLRVAAGLIAFGMGCGESTAPPAPVATVVLTPAAVELVPGGVDMLLAIPKDAAGNSLTNRITEWSTSDPSTVTVATGVVTGVALGSATVTASVEGHTASMEVKVKEGAVCSASGASFSAQNSLVSVNIPAGALTQTRNITVAPATSPPPNDRLMPGTAFEFGPNGTSFAQPVNITIKYDPSTLTADSPEDGLQLYEVIGTSWRVVAGSTVNTTTKTVTGSVSHFTVYGVLMQARVETVAINRDTTVQVKTTVQFTAALKDNEQQPLTRPITWTSSSPATVAIDANGLASALLPGQSTVTATSEGKSSTANVTVVPGPASALTIVAGDGQSVIAGSAVPVLPAVKVSDAFGNAAPGFAITFAVASGGGTITGGSATTNASGIATVGSWTIGTTAVPNTLTASGTGLTPASVTFTVAVPAKIVLNGGDGQTARISSAVPVVPAVRVVDAANIGAPGFTVSFTVTSGGGSVTGGEAITNINGFASVASWVLGPNAGPNTLTATAGTLQGSPIVFTATGVAPPPVAMAISAGNQQSVPANTAVPVRPAVLVTDAAGKGAPNVTVAFTIRSGAGSISGASAVTDASGIATLGSWTLGIGGNSLLATVDGLSGSPLVFVALGTAQVQVVTFGDSNTDFGFSGTNFAVVAASYVSNRPDRRLDPNAPNNSTQLAGKIESRWRANRSQTIKVVNHGVAGTTTGDGRTILLSPNARDVVNGVTRFAGEAIGVAYPWSGGEPVSDPYPTGSIQRVQAFTPRTSDYLYISMGTNDSGAGISTGTTLVNLEWMVDQWIALGIPASHIFVTTLPPRQPGESVEIPIINAGIRSRLGPKGVRVVDIASMTSNDDGLTWKSASLHVGDSLHYAESVRDKIADAVVSLMLAVTPP